MCGLMNKNEHVKYPSLVAQAQFFMSVSIIFSSNGRASCNILSCIGIFKCTVVKIFAWKIIFGQKMQFCEMCGL